MAIKYCFYDSNVVYIHRCGEECQRVSTYGCSLNGSWVFRDEAYNEYGPYRTEHEARIALVLYCFFELEGGWFTWRGRIAQLAKSQPTFNLTHS